MLPFDLKATEQFLIASILLQFSSALFMLTLAYFATFPYLTPTLDCHFSIFVQSPCPHSHSLKSFWSQQERWSKITRVLEKVLTANTALTKPSGTWFLFIILEVEGAQNS